MLRLACPECGQPIAAEQINVQQMVAVCSACDTVFRFDIPDQKIKRRKVKRPERIRVSKTDGLALTYRRVLGREAVGASIGIGSSAALFTFIFAGMISGVAQGDVPIPVLLLVTGFLSFLYYALSLILLNQTRIFAGDTSLQVSHRPVPNPFTEKVHVPLVDIVNIYCEETQASIKAGSISQEYHVFAELADENRVIIAKELPQAYAFFIEQTLKAYLFDMLENDAKIGAALRDDVQSDADESAQLLEEARAKSLMQR